MYIQRHEQLGVEILKWLALLTLAAAAAVAMTRTAAGQSRPDQPPLPRAAVSEVAVRMWQACELHRQLAPEAARALWLSIEMPCQTEVWRQVALGVTYLRTADLNEAAAALDEADLLEPHNGVVHYFLGILRLEQARLTDEWYDHVTAGRLRYASHGALPVVPNTRTMYELAALMELRQAIEWAGTVDPSLPLLPTELSLMEADELSMPVAAPTVGDLLEAVGADNFAGRAHNMLAYLYLDRNALDEAEQHLDSARMTGLHTVYGYQDLAQRYEAAERYSDASRAHLKSLTEGHGLVRPLQRAWKNLRQSVGDWR